jgi:hypothetical protein
VRSPLGLLALTLLGCAGTQPDASASVDARAAGIDSQAPRMRRDTVTVQGLSTEGAGLEAAYSGSALRRLRAEFVGETGRAVETFYFDSALFLVRRTDFRYDAPHSGRIVDSTTSRYDLTSPSTPQTTVDSLRAAARDLLIHLPPQ